MDKSFRSASRRGFLFQSSEIYGGLNGFWDYGPLGVELKRNVKEAWWQDMVTRHNELLAPKSCSLDLRNGRLGLHHHHASPSLEMLGSLRPLP
jgi:glycyl-tRNA synthetase (class II)